MKLSERPAGANLLVVVDALADEGVKYGMTILSGYGEWMLARNHSPNTQKQRLNFAKRLLREWHTFDVPGSQAVRWLNQFDAWTMQTYLTHMQSVYAFLVDAGLIAVSPLEHVRRPPVPPPTPRPLTPSDRDLVLGNCSGDLRAYCYLGYFAGLRVHEVAKICGDEIDEHRLHVVGKGAKPADLPTHPILWELAHDYPRSGHWFPSRRRSHLNADTITTRVTAYFRELGIETGSLHRLRHTFATDMARNGVHPRVIQELMRHSSLTTTMRYLEASLEERRLAIAGLAQPAAMAA